MTERLRKAIEDVLTAYDEGDLLNRYTCVLDKDECQIVNEDEEERVDDLIEELEEALFWDEYEETEG